MATKRITLDVNQIIMPTLSMRVDGTFQDADAAGGSYISDDRWARLTAIN